MGFLDGRLSDSGWRILIVGTGGQGVLSAARLLCDSLVELGHCVVSGQLHGMAQRGGSVESSVIIDGGISPVIPSNGADFILGFEPVETARALPFMSSHTVVYMNTAPVIPYILGQRTVLKEGHDKYPDVRELSESIRGVTTRIFSLDATCHAVRVGSARALNLVMLGCLIGYGSLPCTVEDLSKTIARRMPAASKETNNRALLLGVELVRDFRLTENG